MFRETRIKQERARLDLRVKGVFLFCFSPERNFVYHEGEDASAEGGVK